MCLYNLEYSIENEVTMWTQVQYLSNSKYIEIITIDDEEDNIRLQVISTQFTVPSPDDIAADAGPCVVVCLDFSSDNILVSLFPDEIEEIERVFFFSFMLLDLTIADLCNLKSKPFSWKWSGTGKEGKSHSKDVCVIFQRGYIQKNK